MKEFEQLKVAEIKGFLLSIGEISEIILSRLDDAKDIYFEEFKKMFENNIKCEIIRMINKTLTGITLDSNNTSTQLKND